jgi:hypothetical protein
MHDWNYTTNNSINLTLCADARLGPTDYLNDQIWELNIGNSEPPAISFQTTFGLRARVCRIFPRFILNGRAVNDPSEFHHSIIIHQYFPNYLKLSCKPFPSINVQIEYWVPNSQTIAGRTTVINSGHESCKLQINWAELLIPSTAGHRMAIQDIGLIPVLAGETADLIPVFLLSGGNHAGKSPYPSLSISYNLPSHGKQTSKWAHASLADLQASFEQAKTIINKNWDAEFSRVFRVYSENIEVITGNQDWNTAFYLSQLRADQLILQSPTINKPITILNQRIPDQSFSFLEDASDNHHLWNGLSLLETYYLSNFILPSSRDILRGVLDNCLTAQSPEGEIKIMQTVGGLSSRILAPPLFSTLSWHLYEYTGDIEFLKHYFPYLISNFFSWFTEDHDQDRDLIPEWDQMLQTGLDTNPHFSYVNHEALGIDISTVESPDLCAYLFNECQSLISIAREIGESETLPRLEKLAGGLKIATDQLWNDQHACFLFRDRDSHASSVMQTLGSLEGNGIIDIHKSFQQPVRPIIHIKSKKEGTHPTQIYIHGTLPNGSHRVEHISSMQGHWQMGYGYFTSQNTYQEIEHIQVMGTVFDDLINIFTSGYICLDQTGLLPLWAGLVPEEKAKILINLTIMNKKKFLGTHGLRSYIDVRNLNNIPADSSMMNWLWTSMILNGLVRYGERKNSAEIFSRLMKTVVHSLENDLDFYQFYHYETGQPIGLVNTLTSLVPIGSFLDIVGVKIISSTKVNVTGSNPFPWPVSIKYRGLTVVQQDRRTIIIFPNGQNITVDNHQPQTVSLES